MKRVKVLKGGIQTHGAEMEDPSAWIDECLASGVWGEAGTFEVVIEDISVEVAQKEAEKNIQKAKRDKLKALKKSDIKNLGDLADLILDIRDLL